MKDTYKVYVIVNEVLSNQVDYELKPVGSGQPVLSVVDNKLSRSN